MGSENLSARMAIETSYFLFYITGIYGRDKKSYTAYDIARPKIQANKQITLCEQMFENESLLLKA